MHVYDENPQNVRGSLIYYPDVEYRLELFDTREEEDLKEIATIWHLWIWRKMPELSKAIDFDPEGSMFGAYSSKVDALARFDLIERVCDDTNTMKDLFSRAELD